MALQLTWYKMRGDFTATYETALTRMFDKGRTETIRTLTKDSRAFVLAMLDTDMPVRTPNLHVPRLRPDLLQSETKFALLRRAIQTHSTLTREAATGRGIDRHLMGLRLMLRSGERAPLLDDEVFARSAEWKLSTSGLSAGHLFRGTGCVVSIAYSASSLTFSRFGAAYEDGYGINCMSHSSDVKFGTDRRQI